MRRIRRTTTIWLIVMACVGACMLQADAAEPLADGSVTKSVLNAQLAGANRLDPRQWRAYELGFDRSGQEMVCDNGSDTRARRGLAQTVELNQATPAPIVASAWSKAQGVTGSRNSDYSLYLDLIYADGTHLWGQSASFDIGSHDWQRRQVVIIPQKPVERVSTYLLLRGHGGKAWFRDAQLSIVEAPQGACIFDGVAIVPRGAGQEGFQARDVAAGSGFVHIANEALGLKLKVKQTARANATFFDVAVTDITGKDRAITLIYAIPVPPPELHWLHDPRQGTPVRPGTEHMNASRFQVGANGRLSRYPFAAVAGTTSGVGLGIDPAWPAFYRAGYNAGTGELFLAYDLGLAPEKPTAKLRFCRFAFEPQGQFRAALSRFYEIFPDCFRCRTREQGLWMPFAKISQVSGWEDFGFKFKEGNNETVWDDQHNIITFRYTEPMTWWMRMPQEMPRTLEAALAHVKHLAEEKGDMQAKALFNSGYHNESGALAARFRDTPWCNGAVWSSNAMPGIPGEPTEFKISWNAKLRERLYGPKRVGELDGEYIDSSEGYVTDELDFHRGHFAAAQTPLCFSPDNHRVAIFRGLITFEYVRALARDVHAMDKLMMANSTPIRLCWLAPLLEVMGTETNWHRNGKWQPMSHAELLYRRAMCKGKPFCFLMNTHFEEFSHQLVERYMKRALAYGMFPGFFSHNASQGHYFTRPELYNRDRPLFKKYVPLCKLVAQAGWEPVTLARSDDDQVYVERFGQRYLTVFNDSSQPKTVAIELDGLAASSARELVTGKTIRWERGKASLRLASEDVAVLEIQ